MNKYFIKIPYSYVQYGYLSGYVYAEDEEEAYDLASDRDNLEEECFDDSDSDGTDYDYNEMDISLEEEDVEVPENLNANHNYYSPKVDYPNFYLSEVCFL
jgi:hypothetical protein